MIERRKCLLITHAATLFSVFAPDVRAAQLRPVGSYVVERIVSQLSAEGLDEHALGELDPAPGDDRQDRRPQHAGLHERPGAHLPAALNTSSPPRTPAGSLESTSAGFTASYSATSTPPAATPRRST